MADLVIVNKKIEELINYENNPRNNEEAVSYVANSIKEFGFKVPVIIDKDNIIVAGHTRVKAAASLGIEEVPCVVANDLSPEKIKAFRLADNKVSEIATWDLGKLEEELDNIANIDMNLFGFDLDFDFLDENAEATDDNFSVEEELDNITKRTKKGDIWLLGKHRLLCGDSTSEKDIANLMNGEKADLLFTDPPYGMGKENDGVLGDNQYGDKLLDFNRLWIPLSFKYLTDVGSWYCWGIDEPLMDIYSEILKPMIKKKEVTFRNLITWDKGSGQGQNSEKGRMYARADEKCLFVMKGRQTSAMMKTQDDYFEGFDPIRLELKQSADAVGLTRKKLQEICGVGMYSHWFTKAQWVFIPEEHYKKLQNHYKDYDVFKKDYDIILQEFYKTRAYFDNKHDNMNNVWHFDRVINNRTEYEETKEHATPKPIVLCARAIKTSTQENGKVLDLFGGSGSTLIASEQLGRTSYLMELNEIYCDLTVRRYASNFGEDNISVIRNGVEIKYEDIEELEQYE